MCELLGMSAAREVDVTDLLRKFYAHSERHPNGWGLAVRRGGQIEIDKEPVKAARSRRLSEILEGGVQTDLVLAHIRYATVGGEAYENSHPFKARDSSGREWTLIHNGTIFNYSLLSPFQYEQEGRTDSERILLYLMHMINSRQRMLDGPMSVLERLGLIQAILRDMARGNKLNLILYDGELMYVHTNYAASLYVLQRDGAAFFSTVPLTDEAWESVPFTTLCAYRNGRCYFQGDTHGGEYIDRPEDTKYLYTEFAAL